MTPQQSCANGHQWPAAAGAPAVCPVCGAMPVTGSTVLLPAPAAGAAAIPTQYLSEGSVKPVLPPAAPPPRVPGYEVLGELGRGGMGVVYKARQHGLNRLVALKMILAGGHAGPDDLARFRVEAEASARLAHPNIVQVYEVGEHNGCPYFSLEFCPGGSLADRLRRGPLPPREAAELVETLARAVQHAHRAGVVHRDLKPANVLLQRSEVRGQKSEDTGREPGASSSDLWPLTSDLRPKIADFGLAKRLDVGGGVTQSGAVMGTPSYMAPEQAGGRSKQVGPAADVYALGAVLYECLTGRPPFQGASALETILSVLEQEPTPPRRLNAAVPAALEAVCLMCLRKEPGERYPSADALADDLRAFLDGDAVLAERGGSLRLMRLLLRESRHTDVLSRWGRVWLWHGGQTLLLFLATDVLRWAGATAAWPFALLWAAGLLSFVVPVWCYRFRGPAPPLTRVEQQSGQVWCMFVAAAILTGIINHLLDLPAWRLLPVLVLECGLAFGCMAAILGGSFYVMALACAVLALAMAWEPRLGATAFGVCFAVGLWVPGWRYSFRAGAAAAEKGW